MKIPNSKSTLILSGIAMLGVSITAILSFIAGRKTAHIPVEELKDHAIDFTPAVAAATATTAAIGFCQASNMKIAAGAAVAAGAYAKKLYDTNASVRKLGDDTFKKVQHFVSEKRAKDALPYADKTTMKNKDDGTMLCFEPESEQFFRATKDQLLWAELIANKSFYNIGEFSLNQLLKLLPGCKTVEFGDRIMWETCSDDGAWDYLWSYYRGNPWIDFNPEIRDINGKEVMVLTYSMRPMEKVDYEKMEDNSK